MADALITIQLEGADSLGGDLQLSQFIEELAAVRNALRQTERVVLRRDEQAVNFRVVNLTHSSPARVTIAISSREPVFKDVPRRISRRFASSLALVRKGHRYAERLDIRTLETFKALASPAIKHDIQLVVETDRKRAIRIDRAFETSVTRLLVGDEREYDELVGRIERVDIHNKNVFDIYPAVGPDRVRCIAPRRYLSEVTAAIGKTVSVEGIALYRKDAPFPYAMRVDNITTRKSDGELPTMRSLHGIAPDATGRLSPEDFIRELRDGYW